MLFSKSEGARGNKSEEGDRTRFVLDEDVLTLVIVPTTCRCRSRAVFTLTWTQNLHDVRTTVKQGVVFVEVYGN